MKASVIDQQSSGYRQGVVLGLTMAEIMLLLIFCLLIALGVALSAEKTKLLAAEQALEIARSELAKTSNLIAGLRGNSALDAHLHEALPSASQEKIDEFWRRLLASDNTVQSMASQGLLAEAANTNAKFFAALEPLARSGLDPDEIKRDVEQQKALAIALDAEGLSVVSPVDLARLAAAGRQEATAQASASPSGHRWPPIIKLSEAGGYNFASGKADLSQEFDRQLRTSVAARLLAVASEFDVDVIEVVGHTDEQPLGAGPSNLDRDIPSVLRGGPVGTLKAADNSGLGMMRALSVVTVLVQDQRLKGFHILPLSGGQLIDTHENLTRGEGKDDVKERRRIEIRLRKSSEGSK